MQQLDAQLAALQASDSDIERVREDAQKLVVCTELLLAMGGILDSSRDPTQLRKVKQKVAVLRTELVACATRQRRVVDGVAP